MKAEIKPTEDPERLKENIEKRVDSVRIEDGNLVVELEDPGLLERTPGIKSYRLEGEEHEGIHGRPVQKQAYARLETREDAVKALMATIDGYDLRILDTEREWDLRQLRRYNPDIKHLKFEEPKDSLDIEAGIGDIEGVESIEIDVEKEDVELVYREMLT
ncbi:MAG: hypothetical protein ABEJ36_05505 [Candidatus Nanosalina sp.]